MDQGSARKSQMKTPHKSQAAAMDRAGELPDGEQLSVNSSNDLTLAYMAGFSRGKELQTEALAAERAEVARLREALKGLIGNPEDPNIGWLGNAKTSRDHFRCEHCGVEDLDCSKIAHLPTCPIPKAIAAVLALTAPGEKHE